MYFKDFYFLLCVYVHLCVVICIHVSMSMCRDQRMVSDPMELEVQAFVSDLTWMLETELSFFARASSEPSISSSHCGHFKLLGEKSTIMFCKHMS